MRIEWLYEARCEFEEQLAYYRSRGGAEAAAGFAGKILGAVERLAAAPRAGVLRRETLLGKHGFRALLVEQYACIYRIEDGVVRVYHLTDASKDNLYEILGVASGATDREVQGTMRNNVFLKSTLRQPVKTALLLAVVALITFAFVSRGAEYLLVKQETERLGNVYRSIGNLESAAMTNGNGREILRYLEENSYVETADYTYTLSAVLDDIYNADTDQYSSYAYRNGDIFFYGRLIQVMEVRPGAYKFYFTPETIAAGYPEFSAPVISLVNSEASISAPDSAYTDLSALCHELEIGGRYLLRGRYANYDGRCHLTEEEACFTFVPLTEDGPWYFPVESGQEANLADPALAGVAEDIRLVSDNQHALHILTSRDLSASPAVQESSQYIYLTDGRWLNAQDDRAGRRVCVINQRLAGVRGLQVGDRIDLSLRNVKGWAGYLWEDEELENQAGIETAPAESYEIVGIYSYVTGTGRTMDANDTFIPTSAVPDSFFHEDDALYPGNISFVLTSPAAEADFLTETGEDLASLGVRAVLFENGWANFQAAAKPISQSSLYNALIYTALLAVTLCLVTFIYFRMRCRDIAIARALGVPARQCTRDAAGPLLLIGLPGILAGGLSGWRYTFSHARDTLSGLLAFGEVSLELPPLWLALLGGGVLILLAIAALGGASYLSGRPVLRLMQGGMAGTPKPASTDTAAEPGIPKGPKGSVPALAPQIPQIDVQTGRGTGIGQVLRFVWRYTARSRLKSALAVLLAAIFTIVLSAVWLSIGIGEERLDTLYERTAVALDLFQADVGRTVKGGGIIYERTVRSILDTGFVSDCYLEGGNTLVTTRYEGNWTRGQTLFLSDETAVNTTVRSFDNQTAFQANSGKAVTITYLNHWDEDLFAQDWAAIDAETPDTAPARFPILLPKSLYDRYGLEEGEALGVVCGSFRLCEVAGYYEGTVEGNAFEAEPVFMPTSALRVMTGEKMTYSKVHFSLDPTKNREIDTFRNILETLVGSPNAGTIALRSVLWDEELRLAVAPLENSIELMEVLYPVTLALSLLVAAGIAVLFVMTSAKEAAIMRVLGTSKLRSRVMLALQTAFTSAAGLLIGLAGVLAYTGRTRPELLAGLVGASALCAVLYLLAAIIGAAVSSTAVTSKNPLELLQVRE